MYRSLIDIQIQCKRNFLSLLLLYFKRNLVQPCHRLIKQYLILIVRNFTIQNLISLLSIQTAIRYRISLLYKKCDIIPLIICVFIKPGLDRRHFSIYMKCNFPAE